MSELGTRELIECTYIVAVPVLRSLSEKKAGKKKRKTVRERNSRKALKRRLNSSRFKKWKRECIIEAVGSKDACRFIGIV